MFEVNWWLTSGAGQDKSTKLEGTLLSIPTLKTRHNCSGEHLHLMCCLQCVALSIIEVLIPFMLFAATLGVGMQKVLHIECKLRMWQVCLERHIGPFYVG